MLDMGFADDIKTILKYVPEKRQTIMFSATMAPKIRVLAGHLLNNPETINIALSKPAAGIVQQAYVVYDGQKEKLLKEILKNEDFSSVIIFSSTKEKVKELAQTFKALKYSVQGFSSDLEQTEREEIMRNFKARNLRILIGTDILSRGIDVDGISLVVNFDAPPDPEDYIHRIGRTARAEKAGVAITFINEKDQPRFAQIEALMGMDVTKVEIPEAFGKGPEYNPDANKKKFDKPRGFGGKPKPGGAKSGNKKPFHGPKKV
jgi:superfamily II DNA/RNA helicase